MKSWNSILAFLVLGLSLLEIAFPLRALAGDSLPDASQIAYANHKNKQPKPPPPPKISEVTLTGKINAVQANGIMIRASKTNKTKDQVQWLVVSGPDTEVAIHATAAVNYLRTGQTVVLSGEIVKGDKTADKPNDKKTADQSKDEKASDAPKDDKTADGKPIDGKAADQSTDGKATDKPNEEKVAGKVDDGKSAEQAKDDKADTASDAKVAVKSNEEKVADKVDELTIFSHKIGSAAAKKALAAIHATDSGVGGTRIESDKPESDSAITLPESSDSKTAASAGGTTSVRSKSAASATGSKTTIMGRIASCDAKSLTVTAGERTIHVELADMPTIHVELSSPKITPDTTDIKKTKIEGSGSNGHLIAMQAGDLIGAKIVVHGTAAETKTERQCAAKTIDVTLLLPLSGKTTTSAAQKRALAEK